MTAASADAPGDAGVGVAEIRLVVSGDRVHRLEDGELGDRHDARLVERVGGGCGPCSDLVPLQDHVIRRRPARDHAGEQHHHQNPHDWSERLRQRNDRVGSS